MEEQTLRIMRAFPEFSHSFEHFDEQIVKRICRTMGMEYREEAYSWYDEDDGIHYNDILYITGDSPRINHVFNSRMFSGDIYINIIGGDCYMNLFVDPPKELLSDEELSQGIISGKLSLLINCIFDNNLPHKIQICKCLNNGENLTIPVITKEKIL